MSGKVKHSKDFDQYNVKLITTAETSKQAFMMTFEDKLKYFLIETAYQNVIVDCDPTDPKKAFGMETFKDPRYLMVSSDGFKETLHEQDFSDYVTEIDEFHGKTETEDRCGILSIYTLAERLRSAYPQAIPLEHGLDPQTKMADQKNSSRLPQADILLLEYFGKLVDVGIMKKCDGEKVKLLQGIKDAFSVLRELGYYELALKALKDQISEIRRGEGVAELLMGSLPSLDYLVESPLDMQFKRMYKKYYTALRDIMKGLHEEGEIESPFLKEKEVEIFKKVLLKQTGQKCDQFLTQLFWEDGGMTSNKRRVPKMHCCYPADAETEFDWIPIKKWDQKYFHQQCDCKHELPQTNIFITMMRGCVGGFYFKCVLYDCLLYDSCYLIAWLELCFMLGLDHQMVHVEIPLSIGNHLSPHALCLLLRFVKHGPCVALRESVQCTFGQKKFLYYYSSNSLHLVLNSSCYVTLVEQTFIQQGPGEVEFSMHFHSNGALELVSNLAQDQQDNLVDENQAQRNGQSSDETDPKSSNRKRAIIYRNLNSDRKMLTTEVIIQTYSCKIPTLVVQETVGIDRLLNLDLLETNIIYAGEILETVKRTSDEYAFIPSRASRYNGQPPGSLIRQVVLETTQVISEVSSVIKFLAMEYYEEMLDSFVQSGQVQTMSESTDSALDALLSAFLVVLLSRLAQLRRELAEEELLVLESESTDFVKHFKFLDMSKSLERGLGLCTEKKKGFLGCPELHKKQFQHLFKQERDSNIPVIYHKIKIVIDRLNQLIKEFCCKKSYIFMINRNNTISVSLPQTQEKAK